MKKKGLWRATRRSLGKLIVAGVMVTSPLLARAQVSAPVSAPAADSVVGNGETTHWWREFLPMGSCLSPTPTTPMIPGRESTSSASSISMMTIPSWMWRNCSALARAMCPSMACICLGPRIRNPSRSTINISVPKPTIHPLVMAWSLVMVVGVLAGFSSSAFHG